MRYCVFSHQIQHSQKAIPIAHISIIFVQVRKSICPHLSISCTLAQSIANEFASSYSTLSACLTWSRLVNHRYSTLVEVVQKLRKGNIIVWMKSLGVLSRKCAVFDILNELARNTEHCRAYVWAAVVLSWSGAACEIRLGIGRKTVMKGTFALLSMLSLILVQYCNERGFRRTW